MALALICVGNDIILDCFAFQANSLGQSSASASPEPSPQPSPRRLMKKTSAGVEKVAHPVCCDLAVSLLSLWQLLMHQGWLLLLAGLWMGRTDLSCSITSLSACGDNTPFFFPLHTTSLPASFSPSLPAPSLLNYNNSYNNLYLSNACENIIIECATRNDKR